MKYMIIDERPGLTAVVKKLLETKTSCEVHSKKPDEAIEFNKEDKPKIIQLSDFGIDVFDYHEKLLKDNRDANFLLFTDKSGIYYKEEIEAAGIAHIYAGNMFIGIQFNNLVRYVLEIQNRG